jgi:predicted regulator of Ras-like GTPase activity (Roadblock/LC7/MglB family)
MTYNTSEIIGEMARKLPSLVVAAVVYVEDGLPIAEFSTQDGVDANTASAYLAAIVQSNLRALDILANGQVTDDILITTNQYFFLIRHGEGRPYFLFVMTEKDEWLGRARLVMKEYYRRIEKILG